MPNITLENRLVFLLFIYSIITVIGVCSTFLVKVFMIFFIKEQPRCKSLKKTIFGRGKKKREKLDFMSLKDKNKDNHVKSTKHVMWLQCSSLVERMI